MKVHTRITSYGHNFVTESDRILTADDLRARVEASDLVGVVKHYIKAAVGLYNFEDFRTLKPGKAFKQPFPELHAEIYVEVSVDPVVERLPLKTYIWRWGPLANRNVPQGLMISQGRSMDAARENLVDNYAKAHGISRPNAIAKLHSMRIMETPDVLGENGSAWLILQGTDAGG